MRYIIECLTDGRKFRTLSEAAKCYAVTNDKIKRCLDSNVTIMWNCEPHAFRRLNDDGNATNT
ncbi:hypothetical protein [Rhizobium phage RHph_X2_24]|nr:hypothetical protein [Rhizobium phage RHph_X2_24]